MISHRPQTVQFSAGQRNVFLHITTACNLKCRHCYIDPRKHGRQPVDKQTLMAWLHLFYDPAKTNHLVLLGGEPTLHKHLAAAIHEAKAMGYSTVTVDTNGYCFHDILDRVAPDQAVFSFSLDGPDAALNDALRGSGSFRMCVGNIQKAVAKGFDTSVIFTASRRNIEHLESMPQLLADLGVNRFFIQVIGLRGRAANQQRPLQLPCDQWRHTVPRVARHAAQLGLTAIYPKVYLELGEPFECAGNVAQNYFVFPNGRVYQCPLCEDLTIHGHEIRNGLLKTRRGLTERQLFTLSIPEGCIMNKLLQPSNIDYGPDGRPTHRISCCLLKNRLDPSP